VRILGEKWLAVTWDGVAIPPDTPVIVTDVTGTTLTVRAAEQQWELQ
jgi:membrane protein implicated in regulation of membrane protease activity